MDIHTACYILHTRYDYEGISGNRIVALIRSTQGERYEIAICKFDPGDQSALAALDDRTDTHRVDPLRSHPARDLILVGTRINPTRIGPRVVAIMWAFALYKATRWRV